MAKLDPINVVVRVHVDMEMDRILAMSKEELDAELRAEGIDPDELGLRGVEFVRGLLEKREGEREG